MNNNRLKTILNYIVIFMVFAEAITIREFYIFGYKFFNLKVYNLILSIFIVIFLLLIKKFYYNKKFLFYLSLIIFQSLINVFFYNTTILLVSFQILVISIHSLVFYQLIKYNNYNIKKLFSVYLNIAYFVALIGLLQWLACLSVVFGIFHQGRLIEHFYHFGYFLTNWYITFSHLSIRINSIMPEPFSLCLVLIPALFTSISSLLRGSYELITKKRSILIICVYLLTFSTTGYIGIIIAIMILFLNYSKKRNIFIAIFIAFITSTIFFYALEDTRDRVGDIVKFAKGETDWQKTNQSTYTYLRNLLTTTDVIKNNVLFGNGLGSHRVSFDAFTKKHNIVMPDRFFVLNREDANSLLLRLLSETGLIGVILFLIFIAKYYIKRKNGPSIIYWVINNGILILFIIRLIRQGNYVSEGFFFFFWMYYFTNKFCLSNSRK